MKATLSVVSYGIVMVRLLRIHAFRGTLSSKCYVDEVLSRACPNDLSDEWKQFSLPARQCPTPYMLYGKELFGSQSCQHPIGWPSITSDLPKSNTSWYSRLGTSIVIPSKLPQYPNWNIGWLNDVKVIH